MFQVAIGRIGSAIEAPFPSLDLRVFMDAGGHAANTRVWGGLVVVEAVELQWLERTLAELKTSSSLDPAIEEELKGASVLTADAQRLGARIRNEDRRILFWSNWYPETTHTGIARVRTELMDSLKGMRSDQRRADQSAVNLWFRRMEDYFRTLKDTNRHKLMSTLAHFEWLVREIARARLGQQLRSATVVVDGEGFPDPEECGLLAKAFIVASLQSAGMSYKLTGCAFRELATDGAVRVDMNGDSRLHAGLQFADILLQVVQRRLPSYGHPALSIRKSNSA